MTDPHPTARMTIPPSIVPTPPNGMRASSGGAIVASGANAAAIRNFLNVRRATVVTTPVTIRNFLNIRAAT